MNFKNVKIKITISYQFKFNKISFYLFAKKAFKIFIYYLDLFPHQSLIGLNFLLSIKEKDHTTIFILKKYNKI